MIRHISISFLLIYSIFPILFGQESESIVEESDFNAAVNYYNEATDRFENGQFELALKGFDEAIKLNPNNSDYFYGRACSYYEIRKYTMAIEDLKQAIVLEPKQADYHNKLADCYFRQKIYDKAIENYELAINFADNTEININEFNCKYNLGISALFLKKYEQVETVFSELINEDDEYGDLYYNRGFAKMNLKKIDEACQDFKKALSLDVEKASKHISRICK